MSHTQATGAHGDAALVETPTAAQDAPQATHGGPRYGSRCNASRRLSESAPRQDSL
jgi:hypothetical protein